MSYLDDAALLVTGQPNSVSVVCSAGRTTGVLTQDTSVEEAAAGGLRQNTFWILTILATTLPTLAVDSAITVDDVAYRVRRDLPAGVGQFRDLLLVKV